MVNPAAGRRKLAATPPAAGEPVRVTAEHAPDLIAVFDAHGRRLCVNSAYEQLFGDGMAAGTGDLLEVHPEDRLGVQQALLNAVETGAGGRAEFRFVAAGGGIRYVESQVHSLRAPESGEPLVAIISRDVTEQRRTDDMLRTRELQLQEAYAIANIGSWEWDIKNNILAWSPELRRIMGVSDAFQPSLKSFLELVHPDDRDWAERTSQLTMETGVAFDTPFRILRPDGVIRIVESRNRVSLREGGKPAMMVGIVQDVTDKKMIEDRASESAERFNNAVESLRDYAICVLDSEGRVATWNRGARHITGYETDEIVGKHFSCFYPAKHVLRGDPARHLVIALIEGQSESEGWHLRKNGSQFWAQVILSLLRDSVGKARGFNMTIHDITERKDAVRDLRSYAERLRATSRRLVEIQEAERRYLATELHDMVGQNLSALGLNLTILQRELPPRVRAKFTAHIEESRALVNQTGTAIRNVMGALRPQLLDDYGLVAALRSIAASLGKRTGIQATVSGGDPPPELPKPVELAMFRISQEALNNVAKHSSARRVEIGFLCDGDRAMLSVHDNGIGFDPKRIATTQPNTGWGHLIMRERAEAVGARFTLESSAGAGVRVVVEYRL
jgi:PAS domain S-box-containing protein